MGVDLTKGFYFSFTYHLAATLQCNYQSGLAGAYAAAAAAASTPSARGQAPPRQGAGKSLGWWWPCSSAAALSLPRLPVTVRLPLWSPCE